ncbi:MAG: hypothetical protein V7K50_04830 [Nostoc sp.]|uniref:hypothetical protein n=1 Tax=Nostoc sp. TaxID=1180 RepID=UPI002FF45CDB
MALAKSLSSYQPVVGKFYRFWHWALGTCTEFRHFDYAQCIATLNYRVRVASRREVVGAASPRVVLGMGEE